MVSMRKVFSFPFKNYTSCADEIFHPNAHLQHLRTEGKFTKIGWIPLKIQDFCSDSVQVESGKFEMLPMCKVSSFPLQNYNTCAHEIFHPNAHVQHLGAEAMFSKIGWIPLKIWDFCWDSVQVESGKFQMLSMRKVFSFRYCKTIIPAHMKFSAQMPTFNIFELKQSFLKSVEYLWRYMIFAGTVYRLTVGNLKCCRCAKFCPFATAKL